MSLSQQPHEQICCFIIAIKYCWNNDQYYWLSMRQCCSSMITMLFKHCSGNVCVCLSLSLCLSVSVCVRLPVSLSIYLLYIIFLTFHLIVNSSFLPGCPVSVGHLIVAWKEMGEKACSLKICFNKSNWQSKVSVSLEMLETVEYIANAKEGRIYSKSVYLSLTKNNSTTTPYNNFGYKPT